MAMCFAFLTSSFAQIDHWETLIYASDNWKYHVDNASIADDWRSQEYNDATWEVGPGGFGYGDGDDQTIIPNTPSVYLRTTFDIADLERIVNLYLHADYDDAFVAFLNGVEIARANIDGVLPAYDASSLEYREALMYQGGLPEGFLLQQDIVESLLVSGQNTLAIQVHNYEGLNSSDMSALFWLSAGVSDTQFVFGQTPNWFPDLDWSSQLPIVRIFTGGVGIPDEPSIPGRIEIVYNGDGQPNHITDPANELDVDIEIERRGQSSLWVFPKNNFGFESKNPEGEDMDIEFLDFPAEEDWILHGPYSDKTFLRNALAMFLARQMGQYASRMQAVELFINENYEGLYLIMERIKRDDNRVDIAKLRPEEISGDDLTGGYIIKIDKGEPDWYSRYDVAETPGTKLTYQYVSPQASAIVPKQEEYIQSYIDSMEQAFAAWNGVFAGKHYTEFIDRSSFIDHFLLTEISKDVDAYRLSSYFHKDKDSKDGRLKAGPVWDFNIAFGNQDDCNAAEDFGYMYFEHCARANPFWWGELILDSNFKNLAKCRWEELRSGPWSDAALFGYIDEQAELLSAPAERNFDRWPILNQEIWPNPVVTGSFQGEINYLKEYLEGRLTWLDNNLFGQCDLVNTSDEQESNFSMYPNPVSQGGHVYLEMEKDQVQGSVEISDLSGRQVLYAAENSGSLILPIEIQPGLYSLQFKTYNGVFSSTLLILP